MAEKQDSGWCRSGGLPEGRGLYDPAFEHDACGVGFLARLDSQALHSVVEDSIEVLVNLEHRGAVGGDKATGDGAGLLLRLPDAFLRKVAPGGHLPEHGDYAVAMVFLPRQPGLAERCMGLLERSARNEGMEVLGWRAVPTSSDHLGELARAAEPVIRQLFLGRGNVAAEAFERKLYVVRRSVENEAARWDSEGIEHFYIVSLSSRLITYKGMLKGTQLVRFYHDLADADFASPFVVVHQRYSTNTFPTWSLAQPFRMLAHNGEINTLRGNVNHMRSREADLESDLLGDDIERIKPVIVEGGSDSAMIDNALELLVMAGRSLPHAMLMMVPEAWGAKFHMSDDRRAFYEYHSAIMEPWDGPAALVFTDGRYIGATLDRNGLRPCRYMITDEGYVVVASETGVLQTPPERIVQRGRLQPGKMLLVDLEQKRVVPDNEIKAKLSRQSPYRRWVTDNRIELRGLFAPSEIPPEEPGRLLRLQHAFGYTQEEMKMVLAPMALQGQEAIGSMGNDAALAVLSDQPQLLFGYFKQLFAQVTNPPIDPLREQLVMSVMGWVGEERNLLTEGPEHVRRLKLSQPVLAPEDMLRLRNARHPDVKTQDIDILFAANGDATALEESLERVFSEAEEAIADGANVLVLTDRQVDSDRAAIPVLLAVAGLHHHLIRRGLRTRAGIVAETGEAREVMHFALLIGYGANAVCPHVAFSTLRTMAEQGFLQGDLPVEVAADNYITAIKKGLLKTFSRMGISTIRSYFGAQIFEAVGLNHSVIDRYFCGTTSRVEGIGLAEITRETLARHGRGFPAAGGLPTMLAIGGQYLVRSGGEKHLWSPDAIYRLQHAVRTGDYETFKEYSRVITDQSRSRVTLRSLFELRKGEQVPIGEVEHVDSIVKRFCSAAMSFGSISKEAHETLAVAMNRLGARSNSGEGGEDPHRYHPLPDGSAWHSRVKQVASGRFGVNVEYMVNCDELQIKMAQGAKPGEGGQLPGHKVSEDIARVRHTTPGVTLISPPPHHDIYSIEDLAQLIYDLKMANPSARVSVKLVSEVGVGTIAAGVAKGKADMVLISGHDGGTGASPLTAIKHAGLPWELGLADTQHTLVENRLRERVRVQVDGQLKTGRDLAVAALLGAEEFGFGSSVLVCMGCVMVRKCHMNTCPVGIATQDPELRKRFAGKPEHVENFMRFIAQELREYMAELGFRTVDEMVGRSDMLNTAPAIEHWKASGLDFTRLLVPPEPTEKTSLRCTRNQDHTVEEALDNELIRRCRPALEKQESVHFEMPIRNVHRTVGGMLSGEIARRYGAEGLPDDTIRLSFSGSAGQSLGAWLARGVTIRVEGDTNDYLGKGLSGGRIILVAPRDARFQADENIIAGNTVLYGATDGEVFINGIAGERFAVRNSGATAVVEGVGDHGCEYMTGGTVVVLGPTGYNFAAGMSGGTAYVYDESDLFGTRCNLDMVDLETVWQQTDRSTLRRLVERHHRLTGSTRAERLLDNWEAHLPLFVKVMPIDYRKVLERMRMEEYRDAETVSATEEVYHG